ncbi:gamma-glutamyl-gamma-aminobutyrate hydrolase family protein [Sinomonas sp. ASV322]|uniref:gamma-glutamyl-gamma-aminobutyrate hydrolase family protein n=1 Tax=Sinomonas sp. ASV322 TaxID=3041920 RepID=UPI0027DB6E63|nr:gamma-glutamyl-gamma-aminobutyrate hydrolase family protein [Sinomonas sp. ASV322]MDQ4504546.1 gamma-glutamyl-gamma-aminobutyrate hydrolase family protein [Sinomonas sp. ASV322]
MATERGTRYIEDQSTTTTLAGIERPSPRIAVTWAATAPSHEDWFHAELDALTRRAAAAVERSGGTAVVLDAADPKLAGVLLAGDLAWDGLLVMGGGDVDPVLYDGDPDVPTIEGVDANADAFEASAVVQAVATGRPVLGICRGLQIINVALGGSLREDLGAPEPGSTRHRNHEDPARLMVVHDVDIAPGSRLADALGERATVVSGHHQAAARIAPSLYVTATAPDGIVEGVEAADPAHWLVAVQWHPEDAQTQPGQLDAIVGAFAEACRARAGDRAQPAEEALR